MAIRYLPLFSLLWDRLAVTTRMISVLTLTGIEVRPHPSLPPLLAEVNLVLRPGETLVVVGSNGSGKSTLARVIAGLIAPTEGTVSGESRRVGLVLQDPESQLVGATVADDVAFGLESQGLPRQQMVTIVDRVLGRFALRDLRDRAPHALSGGQQQRVALAGVSACAVDVLVLDEPTSHLDREHRGAIYEAVAGVRSAGVPVVWITQQLDELALADRVVALEGGRVVFDGTPGDFVADPALVEGLGLELPGATRVALALRDAGLEAAHAALPIDDAGLLALVESLVPIPS